MIDIKKPDVDQESLSISDILTSKEVNLHENEQAEDIPPNGGYGWVCVACTFGIMGSTWGLNSVRSQSFKSNSIFVLIIFS
jgi:hypothetical protein